jgi:hypothetical protein
MQLVIFLSPQSCIILENILRTVSMSHSPSKTCDRTRQCCRTNPINQMTSIWTDWSQWGCLLGNRVRISCQKPQHTSTSLYMKGLLACTLEATNWNTTVQFRTIGSSLPACNWKVPDLTIQVHCVLDTSSTTSFRHCKTVTLSLILVQLALQLGAKKWHH